MQPLYVDCANGVGSEKLAELQRHVPSLRIELRNTGGGELNGGCGADAVQKGPGGGPALPAGFESVPPEARCECAKQALIETTKNGSCHTGEAGKLSILTQFNWLTLQHCRTKRS